jgi:hypothetical protein
VDTTKLSQAAHTEYERLTGAIADLVSRDRKREPKLNDDEKAEIADLETRIEFLTPRVASLLPQLNAAVARQTELDHGRVMLVVSGKMEAGELASELVSLKLKISILQGAYTAAATESERNRSRIARIKELAREREVRS